MVRLAMCDISCTNFLDALVCGDCLKVMPRIPDASVDCVVSDLPYGTTACKWDSVIPFAPLWAEWKRLLKPNGAIVLTACQPFTSALVMSNVGEFRYAWTWLKSHASGFQYAKYRPMQKHEDVLVFGRGRLTYNPQMEIGKMKACRSGNPETPRCADTVVGGGVKANLSVVMTDKYYPNTQLHFGSGARCKSVHPTQKPLALMRYLIRTYTNAGETVIDPCMGSGTTCLAAMEEGRHYIGIDNEKKYVDTAMQRIEMARGLSG
jgi:site-specific DNA-methyltransferase (adenine-specific)